MRNSIISVCLLLISVGYLYGQDFRIPRPSPDASVSQDVGITRITIDYSSPGVKGRTIWGELVPYGKVWRTGANEVTSITFSTPVNVNGNKMEAGTYGIHMIPGREQWEVIFSGDTKTDDPMDYDSSKDVLRIMVKPQENPFTERMAFTITDFDENSAKVNLLWDKLKVTFGIEVETQNLVLENARNLEAWADLNSAAAYCLQNNINLDEGFKWIEASVLINENYWNQRIKAQYLAKMGKVEEAVTVMEKAIDQGAKMKNPPFDFDNMKKKLSEWKAMD
jgi:hypothetical protein